MKVAKFEQKIWVELKDHQKALEFARQAATLVEREECAKVCEAGIDMWPNEYHEEWDEACANRAAAIRARGLA